MSTPSAFQLEPLVKRLQKIDTQLTGRTGAAAGSTLNDLVTSLEAIASSLGSLHDLQSVLLRIEAADAKIRQQPTSAEYPHTMTEVLQRLEIVGPALAQIPAEYQQKPTPTPAAKPTPAPTSTSVPTSTPASAPAPVKSASPAVKPTPAPAAAAAPEPVKADGQKTSTPTPTPAPAPAKAPATSTSPTPAPASSVPTAGRCPKNGTLVCHCNDKPKSTGGAYGGSGSAYGVNKDVPTKPASTPAAAPAAAAPKPAAPAPAPAPVAAASSSSSSAASSSSSSSSGPHYSHDQLKAGLPAGVDPKNKELHLEDHVFESLFKMSKEAWGKVAGWKKEIEKKKHGLF